MSFGFSSLLNSPENMQDESLFDADTKDSGFCDDLLHDGNSHQLLTPFSSLEDLEETVLEFPHDGINNIINFNETPTKTFNNLMTRKRYSQQALSSNNDEESPSVTATNSFKKLKLIDNINDEDDDHHYHHHEEKMEFLLNNMKEAVERSEKEELIGDFSKGYALPTNKGSSHPDLKCITVDTIKDLIDGKFSHIIHSFTIIDSRYPYEFQGGHIQGAKNIYTMEKCLELLNMPHRRNKNERHILIFHCEFSKERGPNMIRNLRKQDRSQNSRSYPELKYPEIYVLEGGYKKFYETFPQYCYPMEYTMMLHPNHVEEMNFFRIQKNATENSLLIQQTGKKYKLLSKLKSKKAAVRKSLSSEF